jgi:hypothetical protein
LYQFLTTFFNFGHLFGQIWGIIGNLFTRFWVPVWQVLATLRDFLQLLANLSSFGKFFFTVFWHVFNNFWTCFVQIWQLWATFRQHWATF